MTKVELAEKLSRKLNLTVKETTEIINIFFGEIVDALASGDKVELRGFGSFRIRHRAAREGRNPKSGEQVIVPAKVVPFFRMGKELKELLNK
ncbi:MAG: HU family DNA-binding protein [Nitrospinota bacterium]|nr:integration host factor subunit beta [Nitrospinota bacterium]